jgi:hypothetical protein
VGKSELFLIESLKERWRAGSPCGKIITIFNGKFERKMARRITMWVNQNFLLPTELQPAPKLDIKFLSLRLLKNMINLYNYYNYVFNYYYCSGNPSQTFNALLFLRKRILAKKATYSM